MAGRLARLFGRKPEERRGEGFLGSLGLGQYYGGSVSPREAESLGAVLACVELITGAISSLPAELSMDAAEGSAPAPPTAAAWRILTRPNSWQSWPSFMSWLVGQYLLHGNAVAWIQTDLRGAVSGLVPVPWPWLLPQTISSADGFRKLAYDQVQISPESVLLGLPKRMFDTDVMHVRARSDHGIIGRSVLSRTADPVREGLEISRLALGNWSRGMRPSAVLSSPTYLTDTQRSRYGATFIEEFSGAINAGKVPILEGGWKLDQAALSSVDSQFAEMRALSVGEICRMFSVPEQLIQPGARSVSDLAPYTTAFAQHCLAQIVAAIQAEFDHAVLPAGQHLELDLDGLARGSFSATVAALAALKQSGVISANDARAELGWPPRPDGDALAAGNAPNWPADATGLPHNGPSPGPRGTDPPAPGTHGNEGAQGRPNGKMLQ